MMHIQVEADMEEEGAVSMPFCLVVVPHSVREILVLDVLTTEEGIAKPTRSPSIHPVINR